MATLLSLVFSGGPTDDQRSADPPNASTLTVSDDASDASWRRHRFRLIYDANYDDVWRYCLRRAATPEEAEDALHETFMVAWRRLDIVPTGDEARPWLFGVARNHLRSGWRKYKRAEDLRNRLISVRQPASPDPAELVADDSSAILTALSSLKEKDQEILRLAAWEQLPHHEIASMLGCSENAVAIRVHRARGRLEKALAKSTRAAAETTRGRDSRESVKGQSVSPHVVDEPAATDTEGGLA